MKNYEIAQLDVLTPLPCPCGTTQRGFIDAPDAPASVHYVSVKQDSRVHYHKRMTEIYVVLEGTGEMELDGERIPVRPLTSLIIRPGCRHRAVGQLKILNFAIPVFDAEDEWFD